MPDTDRANTDTGAKLRLDKWLWHARFFKTRSLASKVCKANKVRINGTIAQKSSATVKVGDMLTFPQANQIKVVKLLDLGTCRGPASEAQLLYDDQSPKIEKASAIAAGELSGMRDQGAGRPTKAERRAITKLHGKD
ncbi:MAG: RNA-binding protein S4 [Kordiimonadales bacterium]|nr:MAG: RNA-binding protein S4 [Kordiimonadales bacterium]